MALNEAFPLPLAGRTTELVDQSATKDALIENILPANTAFVTTDADIITQARKITAVAYLKKKYITAHQISHDGTIDQKFDSYVNSSDYYVATNSEAEVAATTRKIRYDSDKGPDSFPVWTHRAVFDADKVELIESLGLENCVEISALAKNYGKDPEGLAALRLYRSLIQDALVHDEEGNPQEKVFIMALSPNLYKQLTTYFDGAIKRIGPNLDYPGEEVVPAMMQPMEGMIEVIDATTKTDNPDAATHAFIADFVLSDASKNIVHPELIEALERNGMDDTLVKYTSTAPAVDVLTQGRSWKRNMLRAGLLGATIGALVFEQGPTNEAARTALALNVQDSTHNPLAAGGAIAAMTMAIETGAGGLIALGLHEDQSRIMRIIQKFKRKSTPELDEDGKIIEKERTLSTKAGDLALAVSIGPGIAMTKRHLQEAEPKMRTDINRLLGYSAVGAALSGGIAYLVTGGVENAEKVGLGTPAEYVANYGDDLGTWAAILGVIYGYKAANKVVNKIRRKA